MNPELIHKLSTAGIVSVDAMDGEGFIERTATYSNGEDAIHVIDKWCREYSIVQVKSMDTGAVLYRYQFSWDEDAPS